MYALTTDESVFHRFWQDEKSNTPRWFNDASDTWTCSWDDFKGFCRNAERVYLIENSALLYVERIGNNANIHFSLIRGEKIDVADLIRIRGELFKDFEMIFGWVGTHNRGLKKIMKMCGLEETGFKMFHGFSHGKLLTWHCFSIVKNNIVNNGRS